MKRELSVNPFVNVISSEGGDSCSITCPKPGSGMQILEISRRSHSKLFDLFGELSSSGFQYFDPDADLDPEEIAMLSEKGILMNAAEIPELSIYCCLISTIDAGPVDKHWTSFIVSPSFRYASFDFTDLAKRLTTSHLSARPSAWVTDEVTGIERGYWFDLDQAAIVGRFEAGKPLPFDIDRELLGRLYAAGIITTEKEIEERTNKNKARLEEARREYTADRYCVVEDIFPQEQMQAMRVYFRKYISNGFMPLDDGQAHRYFQHNEPLARVVHQQLTKLMSIVIGEEVIPSYVYAASYIDGADLHPHTDRPQCEFSISFQVDYLPEQPEHRSPWGLFLLRPEWGKGEPISYSSPDFPSASETDDTNTAVYLASGDGLIYKGRELIHYRYALPAGHQSTSLFFHYVPKNFDGHLD